MCPQQVLPAVRPKRSKGLSARCNPKNESFHGMDYSPISLRGQPVTERPFKMIKLKKTPAGSQRPPLWLARCHPGAVVGARRPSRTLPDLRNGRSRALGLRNAKAAALAVAAAALASLHVRQGGLRQRGRREHEHREERGFRRPFHVVFSIFTAITRGVWASLGLATAHLAQSSSASRFTFKLAVLYSSRR
jgi:hypothetical protein